MPDAIDAGTVQANAEGPRRGSADGIQFEQHPVTDTIKGDQYVEAKRASRKAFWPLRMFKIKQGGAA